MHGCTLAVPRSIADDTVLHSYFVPPVELGLLVPEEVPPVALGLGLVLVVASQERSYGTSLVGPRHRG